MIDDEVEDEGTEQINGRKFVDGVDAQKVIMRRGGSERRGGRGGNLDPECMEKQETTSMGLECSIRSRPILDMGFGIGSKFGEGSDIHDRRRRAVREWMGEKLANPVS